MKTLLPLTETITPEDAATVSSVIADAEEAIYPIGGGTGLDYGMSPSQPGTGLELSKLNRLIDYPSRDMTITVEAGMTIAQLAETLRAERQRLPIEVPQADRATLGGVLATNTGGPRSYGCGSLRDYLIGVTAIDGRGTTYHSGGRVVKNVAGYDFCRLLIGSLGELGVVVELTLKVVPIPECFTLVTCGVSDLDRAETLLASLVTSATTPCAVKLAAGPEWSGCFDLPEDRSATLIVGFEGTEPEVDWMKKKIAEEWRAQDIGPIQNIDGTKLKDVWDRMVEFPVDGDPPLVVKANVLPSRVTDFCRTIEDLAPDISLLADGDGTVLVRIPEMPDDAPGLLVRRLHPVAVNFGGHASVIRRADPAGWTRPSIWGSRQASVDLMEAVKRQFDPRGILNPGRFLLG